MFQLFGGLVCRTFTESNFNFISVNKNDLINIFSKDMNIGKKTGVKKLVLPSYWVFLFSKN